MIRSRYRNAATGWHFNMTPLIDVTFLLLTYFMLASHYSSAEKPDMTVPQPERSQAIDRKIDEKIIVNVLHHAQGEPELTYGPVSMASMDELGDRLADLAQRNEKAEVILRADRRVPYGYVRRVMEMIAERKLVHLQIVAELTENASGT
jgi:biopolymer transport protein ExbD